MLNYNHADPMMFVAAFNNEDPGVMQIAQRCMSLDPTLKELASYLDH